MTKFTALAASATLALALSACAGSYGSGPTAGERITQRGDVITQYGDAWTSGSKDVRDGERILAKSSDQIADARKKLAKAEDDQAKARQMIADGTVRMQQSEADYAAARAGPAAITIPPSN
jgi:septal ring factor EnvC (AmiA/AmiB activator)